MTEHEEEYLRERRAEADAGARERKAGHTAGPWKAGEGNGFTAIGPVPTDDDVAYLLGRPTIRERRANALLIAAAPDLYAAVRLAHAALDAATSTLAGLDLSPGSRLDDLCGELAAAREACGVALGRAEGETE
jgi:hypothetical protein